jgi:hypothetical protein
MIDMEMGNKAGITWHDTVFKALLALNEKH